MVYMACLFLNKTGFFHVSNVFVCLFVLLCVLWVSSGGAMEDYFKCELVMEGLLGI